MNLRLVHGAGTNVSISLNEKDQEGETAKRTQGL